MSKTLGKKIRQAVHQKFGGHCAYCGREITIRQMQVDHAKPQIMQRVIALTLDNRPIYEDIHHIDNLMPSCRACNNYKGANDIEGLRWLVKNLASSPHLIFASPSKGMMLEGLGIVQISKWDGKFYFEKFNNQNLCKDASTALLRQ